MKEIKYVIRLYENGKVNEIEFESDSLPNEFYFSDNWYFYPEITKIELIKVEGGIEKKIKERILKG